MLQPIPEDFIQKRDISLYLLRIDLLHEHISGNKWFKLKYNIAEMLKNKQCSLLTFGGAYSNHIAATAYAGKVYQIKTIGIIRGEKTLALNPTLKFATECGMQLHFISRKNYAQKDSAELMDFLKEQFGSFYLVPQGGSNQLGFKGCKEISKEINIPFQYICCACGTGTTLAGITSSLSPRQYAIGFSALKGEDTLSNDVRRMLLEYEENTNTNWHIETNFHFGGYAKITKDLTDFIKNFKFKHNTDLDLIYTGKMMYGLYKRIEENYFPPKSVIIAIHSGGIQGNKGMSEKYHLKL